MLKLKLLYFGHLLQIANSLRKTLMLRKIKGKRRRGKQRMRWLAGITNSRDMNLSKPLEIVKNRETWHAAVSGFTWSQTWLSDWQHLLWRNSQSLWLQIFLNLKNEEINFFLPLLIFQWHMLHFLQLSRVSCIVYSALSVFLVFYLLYFSILEVLIDISSPSEKFPSAMSRSLMCALRKFFLSVTLF